MLKLISYFGIRFEVSWWDIFIFCKVICIYARNCQKNVIVFAMHHSIIQHGSVMTIVISRVLLLPYTS